MSKNKRKKIKQRRGEDKERVGSQGGGEGDGKGEKKIDGEEELRSVSTNSSDFPMALRLSVCSPTSSTSTSSSSRPLMSVSSFSSSSILGSSGTSSSSSSSSSCSSSSSDTQKAACGDLGGGGFLEISRIPRASGDLPLAQSIAWTDAKWFEEKSGVMKCGICLDALSVPVSLPGCKRHLFDRHCLVEMKTTSCPLCREKIPSECVLGDLPINYYVVGLIEASAVACRSGGSSRRPLSLDFPDSG